MKIIRKGSHEYAAKFKPRDRDGLFYQVLPADRPRDESNRKLNKNEVSIFYPTIEEAAIFLIQHPGSAIRMTPGTRIISKDIVIDLSGEEPPPVEGNIEEIPADTQEE